MARPRKYASAAERQAAYRDRYALIEIRLPQRTAATLTRVSEARDISRNELAYNLIAWALANRDWMTSPLYAMLPRENPDELLPEAAELRRELATNPAPQLYQVQHKPGGSGEWAPVSIPSVRGVAVARARRLAKDRPFDAVRVVGAA
jgi:hypothetical protein